MPPGHEGKSADADGEPLARAEKVENSCFNEVALHAGQASESRSSERRSNFSNFVPQDSHLYSKMGI